MEELLQDGFVLMVHQPIAKDPQVFMHPQAG